MLEANSKTFHQIRRIPMARIEEVVAAHFGPGRVRSQEVGPCFSRQVSMYLASKVGGWSTTRIGRFYGGRHHTTVLHAIAKIEGLRNQDESIRSILEALCKNLLEDVATPGQLLKTAGWSDRVAEDIARRIFYVVKAALLEQMVAEPVPVRSAELPPVAADSQRTHLEFPTIVFGKPPTSH